MHVMGPPEAGSPEAYLFNFLETGTVKIYPMSGGEVMQDNMRELRYIYDPDMGQLEEMGEMALEEYGLFRVIEINTDRMVWANLRGQYTLERYKESDPVEEEEEEQED